MEEEQIEQRAKQDLIGKQDQASRKKQPGKKTKQVRQDPVSRKSRANKAAQPQKSSKEAASHRLLTGRIVRSISSFFYVWVQGEVYECKARGTLKKDKIAPLAGDWAEICVLDEEKKQGILERIFSRENMLIRPPIANVSQAVLVFSIKNPDPNLSLIDRFIVLALEQRLRVVLCFSKMDLDSGSRVEELLEDYKAIGYPAIAVSCVAEQNLQMAKKWICGHVNVLAGPSGAGKSSLLNQLFPCLRLKTGEISRKTGRGRHTTRHVELLHAGEDTWIADTPGFSSLSLDHIQPEALKKYFEEFFDFQEQCRFGNHCFHENEPGCAVKKAVEAAEISRRRYESYLQLLKEIRDAQKRRY